jgi:hypothetical protein
MAAKAAKFHIAHSAAIVCRSPIEMSLGPSVVGTFGLGPPAGVTFQTGTNISVMYVSTNACG